MSIVSKREQILGTEGWIILNKAPRQTSTWAVSQVRKLFQQKKAGHAGTLDPLACGVLPIALGQATKTIPFVQNGQKIYRFTVQWGAATTTDDQEGEILATSSHRPSMEDIQKMLPHFQGRILQSPPIFSALKCQGERAYAIARRGEQPNLAPRLVDIETLQLISHRLEQSSFQVTCGKGTYVRALGRDFGEKLHCLGHICALERLQTGPFEHQDSLTLEDLRAFTFEERVGALLPISAALKALPALSVGEQEAKSVRQGQKILVTKNISVAEGASCYVHQGEELLSYGTFQAGYFLPERVFSSPS